MLALVGLDGYGARFPHELSGGERQRVALARALAPQPRVILLDEPFSSLDPSLRRSLRGEVRRILEQASATAILVTHDPDDALTVGNRVAVLREGRLEQVGAAADVYHHPRNGYCARLFGPANEVKLSPESPTRWIRPERMTLTARPTDQDEERWSTVEVVVDSVRDTGRHAEILVRPVDGPLQDALWTVHAGSVDPALLPGATGWISVEAPRTSPHGDDA